jgi:hypothetical protein
MSTRLSLSGEYFGHYSVVVPDSPGTTRILQLQQNATKVPAQFYLDATFGYRFATGGRDLFVQFGVQNLLDHLPPVIATPTTNANDELSYSAYGDPRGRRFQLSAEVEF